MTKIRVNKSFQDKYTGTIYEVDDVIEVNEKRLEELKDFDDELVSVIKETKSKDDKKNKGDKPVEDKSKDEPSKDETPTGDTPEDEPSKDDASKENEE